MRIQQIQQLSKGGYSKVKAVLIEVCILSEVFCSNSNFTFNATVLKQRRYLLFIMAQLTIKRRQSTEEESDSSHTTSSSSSYSNVKLINKTCAFPNFMEAFSDPQHEEQPPFIPDNEGCNFYLSIAESEWDAMLHPPNVELSFAANDTSFVTPLHYKDLTLCTR